MVEERKRNVRAELHSSLELNLAFYEGQGISPEELERSKLFHTLLDDPNKVSANYTAAINAGLSRAIIEEEFWQYLGKSDPDELVYVARHYKAYQCGLKERP